MNTVLITGANRGLGLELVKKYASEGWWVYATCRDTKNFPGLEEKHNVVVLELDISSQKSIEYLVRGLDDIDVIIHNAGLHDNTSADEDSADMVTVDSVSKIFQTNAIGPKVITEMLLAKQKKPCTVVGISSGMSRFSKINQYNSAHWPYSSSKTALNYITNSIAVTHPQTNAFCVDPGWMNTRMGGKNAPLDPAISAANIFQLTERAKDLENGQLYDLSGNRLEW